jgi:predicted amidohydrolase YtcJ
MIHDPHGCACCQANLGALFGFDPEDALAAEISVLAVSRLKYGSNTALAFATGQTACGTQGARFEIAAPQSETRTRLYHGGTILAVDAAFSSPEAIAIQGERIVAVGTLDQVRQAAGEDADCIDLNGRTLMPGLIDPHTHILIGALMDQAMDYVGMARFATSAEVYAHIRALDAERPEDDWIVCRNYYPMLQPFDIPMGFESLDAISATRPIFVLNASGHIGYANRAAFRAARIDDDVANPEGGEFVRDGDGRLTGEMRNQMTYSKVLGARPGGAGSAPAKAVLETCARFSSLGLTTLTELGLGGLLRGAGDWDILQQVGATGRLTQRIRAYPLYAFDQAWDEAGIQAGDGDALVRMSGYKLIADGSNQGFTGLQRQPYHSVDSNDRPDPQTRPARLANRDSRQWRSGHRQHSRRGRKRRL